MTKAPAVVALAIALVALLAREGAAKCDPSGADAADVANARAAVAANCDCVGAASHGAYVSCATAQARATLLNQSCAGAVTRCAAHSTCGKPGFVTCCRTGSTGLTRCGIKSGASTCLPPKHGAACVGSFASCCDACTASGCATTTSTSTTTTTFPPCQSECAACGGNGCGGICAAPQSGDCGIHHFPGSVCTSLSCGGNCSVDADCSAGEACVLIMGVSVCCSVCP